MNDMSQVIIPKSDQISADDFIAGPATFTIETVDIRPGTEQPVSIFLAGEPRAWKPCKSMSRVLVTAWGPDAKVYSGRSVTLYRDPSVKWGGMEVGGIRISHLSHIEGKMVLQLTATKGKRTPAIIMPLVVEEKAPAADPAKKWADAYVAQVTAQTDFDDLETFATSKAAKLAELASKRPELHSLCTSALDLRRVQMTPLEGGRSDAEHGDQFDGTDDQ